MTSAWDPAYLWRQTSKLLRRSEPEVHVHEVNHAEIPAPSSGGGGIERIFPALSSRDVLLVTGAAAVGGALVVAAVYAAPGILSRYQIECPACGCHCCVCYVAHQRPAELVAKMIKGISSSLAAGKEKIQKAVGFTSATSDEHSHADNNNGSWTCIQVSRDKNSSTTVDVEETQAAAVTGDEEIDIDNRPGLPDPFSATKRKGYLSWDDYFMSIAFLSAQRSKDPIRQVGACLVSQDYVILGIGYNGFPRGCSDDKLPWAKKSRDGDLLKTKYPYVCHAEVNAILNRNHASASGQRLYVTMFPCNECAKVIIQAGIAEVIFYTDKQSHPNFQFTASRKLLSMANVKLRQHQPKAKSIILEF
ncbi:uncharacterized protein LOC9640848 [Selaginella moellendorffii]|uniref:uncharacterized protein LOC9640848 n=1 Tax=Selaginella moellendorffii TaxID=88036 RepID=UPI000D1C4C00|nr:uncharacterized protein LOC9640848 [Selaginella moellendorffii]|eukprot:XP_024522792.1 uncharacterized protein LOC9640848 [Selaginella moellendorffii]